MIHIDGALESPGPDQESNLARAGLESAPLTRGQAGVLAGGIEPPLPAYHTEVGTTRASEFQG